MNDSKMMESLSETIYRKLYNDTIFLKIEPGATLVVKDIAEEMSASTSPVRDAIDRLADRGLVEKVPGRKSPIVSRIRFADCMQLLEVRQSLEAHAAYYAAKRIKDDELEALRQKLEALKITGKPDPIKQAKADAAFHKQIFAASHNEYFISAFARIYPRFLRYLLYVMKNLDVSKLNQYERHLPIYNAIASRSAVLARDEVLDSAEYAFIIMHLGLEKADGLGGALLR